MRRHLDCLEMQRLIDANHAGFQKRRSGRSCATKGEIEVDPAYYQVLMQLRWVSIEHISSSGPSNTPTRIGVFRDSSWQYLSLVIVKRLVPERDVC